MTPRTPYLQPTLGGTFKNVAVVRWLRLLGVSSVVVGSLFIAQSAQAGTRAETLQSINWVENPSNSPRPGRCGELGAYQFRESTWAMHTKKPFASATNQRVSDEVAILHFEWLKNTLVQAGLEPSTYNIALAWNAGVNAVIKGRAPAVAHNYAMRVNNLATDMGSQQLAAN